MNREPVELFQCRKIPNYDGYYVTSQGDVYSSKTPHGNVHGKLKKLVVFVERHGYVTARISRLGKVTILYVHRLVLEAFVGPSPGHGFEASHLNGVKQDNRLANLAWESKKDNMRRQADHGTKLLGEHTNSAKLRSSMIPEIRQRLENGETCVSIAATYGVCKGSISSILRGETWGHIE